MHILTTAQVAHVINQQKSPIPQIAEWQVRRIFELGLLPEPPKFGAKRMIFARDLPAIVDALRKRGWLSAEEVSHGD